MRLLRIVAAMTALGWMAGPAVAQKTDLADSGLVGKFENPTIVTDPAQWPKQFHEAPQLAELVKAGKLPPVEQRIPQEPMVLKPIRNIGKYGGTWRRGYGGAVHDDVGHHGCGTWVPCAGRGGY